MSIIKAYLIVMLFSFLNIAILSVNGEIYGYNFVMLTTVLITSVMGSSVQISHKRMVYNIKGKEVIAIFLTGFFFAYMAYIVGDISIHYLKEKEHPILNPLHIAGWVSASTSFFSIKFLKFLQRLIETTLSGISINVIKALTNFLTGMLKEKDK